MLKEQIKNYDLKLIWLMLILFAISVMNLYSASAGAGPENLYWKTHIYRFLTGAAVIAGLFFIHYRILERFAYLAYALNVLVLIILLFWENTVLGPKRWIYLGSLSFQPSEFMKITVALALAKYFHDDNQIEPYSLKKLFFPLLLIGIPTVLTMMQPDLGTALIILATGACILLFVKIETKLLVAIILGFIVFMPVAYKFILKDYQRQRILSFINPQSDPQGTGYNSIQSMIAIGSGKFLGKGFHKGTQSQLKFLPEHHTDFAFSVFAEEHGFLGAIILLGLLFAFLFQGAKIASQSNDKFCMLFSIGIMSIFFCHIFINIGMTTGILPIVGVPLPFISYGGSYLISCMLSVGVLTSIANRKSMF